MYKKISLVPYYLCNIYQQLSHRHKYNILSVLIKVLLHHCDDSCSSRRGSFCSSRRGSFAQSPQGLGTFFGKCLFPMALKLASQVDRKSTQNSSLGYFATEVVLQRANRKASHATLLGIRRVLANRRTERTFVGEWPSPRRKPPFEGGSALKNRESASWRKQSRCKNDSTGTNKRIEEAKRLQSAP